MRVYTLADITPGGSATALAAPTSTARAIWINATASGSSVRFGDANVGAAQGQTLPDGVPFLAAPRGDNAQQPYWLRDCYVYASSSDKVSITYGI